MLVIFGLILTFLFFILIYYIILYSWMLLLICNAMQSRAKFYWYAGMLYVAKVFSSTVKSYPRHILLTLYLIHSIHMFLVGLIPSQASDSLLAQLLVDMSLIILVASMSLLCWLLVYFCWTLVSWFDISQRLCVYMCVISSVMLDLLCLITYRLAVMHEVCVRYY